jgi:hypothetical protein
MQQDSSYRASTGWGQVRTSTSENLDSVQRTEDLVFGIAREERRQFL